MRTRTILALGVGWEDVLGEDSITAENRVDEENHFEDFFSWQVNIPVLMFRHVRLSPNLTVLGVIRYNSLKNNTCSTSHIKSFASL